MPNGTSASTKPLARPVTRDVSSFITGADAEGNHKEIPGNSSLMEVAAGYRGFRGTKSSPNRWLFSILLAELYVVVNAWAKTCAGCGTSALGTA